MITQVKFISIPVKDQERALKFYTEKLGFRIATNQEMGPGRRWIELRIGKAETRVVLFTMEGEEGRVGTQMNCSLVCDDVGRPIASSASAASSSRGRRKRSPGAPT